MKVLITSLLICPFILFGQRNHFAYSSSYLIPISQTALSAYPTSGELQISPSTYMKGFNYEFDIIDSTWSLKAGAMMGRENYTITNYNSFIDNQPSSVYLPIFSGNQAQIKSAILSLGVQNSYYFNNGKDVFSWNAGVYYNRSQQLDYLFDINVKMVRSVDFAEYYTKIIVPTFEKNPIGFDIGINLRKTILKRFFIELSGRYMPRNLFTYTYQTYNTMNISNNGGYSEYTSPIKEKVFHYGVLNVQLNLGLKF
jgi:hypothetical protein